MSEKAKSQKILMPTLKEGKRYVAYSFVPTIQNHKVQNSFPSNIVSANPALDPSRSIVNSKSVCISSLSNKNTLLPTNNTLSESQFNEMNSMMLFNCKKDLGLTLASKAGIQQVKTFPSNFSGVLRVNPKSVYDVIFFMGLQHQNNNKFLGHDYIIDIKYVSGMLNKAISRVNEG